MVTSFFLSFFLSFLFWLVCYKYTFHAIRTYIKKHFTERSVHNKARTLVITARVNRLIPNQYPLSQHNLHCFIDACVHVVNDYIISNKPV